MKYNSNNALFDKLKKEQNYAHMKVKQYERIGVERLSTPPGENQWSALEALEHIKLVNDYYLNQVELKISQPKGRPSHYRPSVFASQIIPKATHDTSRPFKTVKNMEPEGEKLKKSAVLSGLQRDQERIDRIIEQSRDVNLNQGGIKASVLPWLIRFNVGDTLQLVVFHQRRHFDQADRALAAL